MAAPPVDLVAAMRAGSVVRHLFLKFEHPLGDVLAWDGIGEFIVGAETYLGVGGLGKIGGIGESRDLQSHDIVMTLDGVPRSALQAAAADVRNAPATLKVAWIDRTGTIVASKTLFIGLGDYMTTNINKTTVSLEVHFRGPATDLNNAPRAYYSDQDQKRRFPGDTGFSQIKALEAATLQGWGPTTAPTNDRLLYVPNGPSKSFVGTVSGELFGNDNTGAAFYLSGSSILAGSAALIEETSGAAIAVGTNSHMQCGSIDVTVDVSGDVQTAGTKYVYPSGGTVATTKIKKQTVIAAAGTKGSEKIIHNGVAGYPPYRTTMPITGAASRSYPYGLPLVGYIYENRRGITAILSGTNIVVRTVLTQYVEEVSGTALTYDSASGELRIGASTVCVSSTGAIVATNNRFIYRAGSVAANNFLRVWAP